MSEGYAVGRSFVQFFGSGMGEDFVKWDDKDTASSMWLIIHIARTIQLLGVHFCLWNMVYEWYCEPTARFSRNPYYIYDPEKALIRHLLNYVLLMGISMWFFNSVQFKLLSSLSQRVLLALAFCAAVLTVCYTLRVLEYLMFKTRRAKRWQIFIGMLFEKGESESKHYLIIRRRTAVLLCFCWRQASPVILFKNKRAFFLDWSEHFFFPIFCLLWYQAFFFFLSQNSLQVKTWVGSHRQSTGLLEMVK